MTGFRLQAKNFFLTYPQCNEPKELALEAIIQQFGDDIEYCVVAHENHQDGTDHLHVVLALKTKLRVSSPTYFDFVTGKHGNYQTQRSPVKNLKYITKDGDYVSVGINVVEWLNAHNNKQSTKGTLVANRIRDGATFDEILEEEPGYAIVNKRKIEEVVSYVQQKKFKASMSEEFTGDFNLRLWQSEVIRRIERQDPRRGVLWVWDSVGNRGKNLLSRYLQTKYKCFLSVGGKSEDIAYSFKHHYGVELVVVNFTRDKQKFINYSVIENFKDGNIFSSKYESGMIYFKPCKVVVFANFHPELNDTLSKDRWDIFEIPESVNCHIRDI